MRIVSLLPSATEIVCLLGLEDELVGITHECDHPASVRGLPVVTTTLIPPDATSGEIDALVRERLKTQAALYALDMAVLRSLAPDLLVTQALCDVCAVAEAEVQDAVCRLPGPPRVVNLEPMSLEEVLTCVQVVAEATDVRERGERVVAGLRARIELLGRRSATLAPGQRPRVAFVEWLDPVFGCGHWTPALVRLAGGDEVFGEDGRPSRTRTTGDLAAAEPDVLVVACCGYDVARVLGELEAFLADPAVAAMPAVREGRVLVMNGSDYFSRPGPRLLDGAEILAHALHPDLHPLPRGLPTATWPLGPVPTAVPPSAR
jgi:iron complex transport system substrate-binding protein